MLSSLVLSPAPLHLSPSPEMAPIKPCPAVTRSIVELSCICRQRHHRSCFQLRVCGQYPRLAHVVLKLPGRLNHRDLRVDGAGHARPENFGARIVRDERHPDTVYTRKIGF